MELLYSDKLKFEELMSCLFDDESIDSDKILRDTGYKFASFHGSLFSIGVKGLRGIDFEKFPFYATGKIETKKEEVVKEKKYVISNGKMKILFTRDDNGKIELQGVAIRYLSDKGVFTKFKPWEAESITSRMIRNKGNFREYELSLHKNSHDRGPLITTDEEGKTNKLDPGIAIEENLEEIVKEIREYSVFKPAWDDEGPWWREFRIFVGTLQDLLGTYVDDDEEQKREAIRLQLEKARASFAS